MTGSIHINFAIRTDWRFPILFGRFYFEACNVCKVLMRGFHNLLGDGKVTKNVGQPNY